MGGNGRKGKGNAVNKKQTEPKQDNTNQNKESQTEEKIFNEIIADKEQLTLINKQLAKLTDMLERVRFQEYMEHFNDPKRMMVKSFISGMSRGLGMAVGFTILGAILIELLTAVANNNIPVLSKFIADIIKTVEHYL